MYTVRPMKNLLPVFDLDGTLVDSNASHVAATRRVFQEFDLVMPTNFYQKNGAGMRLRDILEEMGIGHTIIREIRAARDRYHIENLLQNATWLEGAEELLDALRESGKKIGIITNSTDDFVDAMEERLGVRKKTDLIITTTTPGIEKGKPDPTGLLMAADILGVLPEDCVFVGDQGFDVQAGHRARMKSCLIRGPHTSHDGEPADYEVEHIREVLPHYALTR